MVLVASLVAETDRSRTLSRASGLRPYMMQVRVADQMAMRDQDRTPEVFILAEFLLMELSWAEGL